jgi:hypothetical protein
LKKNNEQREKLEFNKPTTDESINSEKEYKTAEPFNDDIKLS